jgi:hypothetical protein
VSALLESGANADGGVHLLPTVPLVAVGPGAFEAEHHERTRDGAAGLGQAHAAGEAGGELDRLLAVQAE